MSLGDRRRRSAGVSGRRDSGWARCPAAKGARERGRIHIAEPRRDIGDAPIGARQQPARVAIARGLEHVPIRRAVRLQPAFRRAFGQEQLRREPRERRIAALGQRQCRANTVGKRRPVEIEPRHLAVELAECLRMSLVVREREPARQARCRQPQPVVGRAKARLRQPAANAKADADREGLTRQTTVCPPRSPTATSMRQARAARDSAPPGTGRRPTRQYPFARRSVRLPMRRSTRCSATCARRPGPPPARRNAAPVRTPLRPATRTITASSDTR